MRPSFAAPSLPVVAAALATAIAIATVPAIAAPPNILIVLTDDQGYGDLSAHGNPVLRTPRLDRLRAESARLVDFHVDPTCSPTRAALMTGGHSLRTGVWHTIAGRSILRGDVPTLPELLAPAGHVRGIFGKWHLGDNAPSRPRDRGFDVALVHGGGGIGQTPDHWGNDYFDDVYLENDVPKRFQGYCADVFADAALRLIRTAVADRRPFLCVLATNTPHSPYRAPPADAAPFRAAGLPDPLPDFYGMIVNIDRNVGRLLDALDELGIADDTIVVFLTDNGSAVGELPAAPGADPAAFRGFNAGMRGLKGSPYEGGHRVPCFIRWPGRVAAGRDVPGPTAHFDLLPTLLQWTGVDVPPGLDGIGLAAVLADPDARAVPERTLIVQSQRIETPLPWRQSAVIRGPWRLVNGRELYDLRDDPGQTRDIAADHPEKVAELRRDYEEWWASTAEDRTREVRVAIGDPREEPVRLTSHDWRNPAATTPWNQPMIGLDRIPPEARNGFWAVDVARAGTYRIEARIKPAERDRPATPDPRLETDTTAPLRADRLRIAWNDAAIAEVPCDPDAEAASVVVELPAGPARLRVELVRDGSPDPPRGAHFATVARVPD